MRDLKIATRLAFRNLRRNRKRSILTGAGLVIGLTVMIASFGMIDGIVRQSVESMVDYDIAHVRGYQKGYLDQDIPDLDYIIEDADGLRNEVDEIDNVSSTIRLSIQGRLIFKNEEAFTSIVGLDLEHEAEVYKTLTALKEGELIQDGVPGVMIGKRLAKSLGIELGDNITLFARSRPGALNTLRVKVKGLLYTGHSLIDANSVFLTMDQARQLVLIEDGATEIDIKTKNDDYALTLRDHLASEYPEYEWESWQDASEGFLTQMKVKRIATGIIIAVLALIAAVAVSNTMVMAVHERTMEIGALRAMGFEKKLISRMFLFEGLFIGLIAGVAALIIGSAIVLYLGKIGISLANYEDMDFGYPMANALYPKLNSDNLIWTFLFGISMTTLASWSAAKRAAKGEVVRALREGML